MTDDSPFAAFVPSTPEATAPPAPAKDKGKRGRKGKGAETKKAEAPAPAKPKKERKPRVAKENKRLKLYFSDVIIATAGLKPDEIGALRDLTLQFAEYPKRSRLKIAEALTKIFA